MKFPFALLTLTLLFGLGASPAILAQQIVQLESLCAEDVSNVGTCNANEVSLSGVTNISITDLNGNPLTQCVAGQQIKIATLEAGLDSNTGTRYDVTFWVGRFGNDPRASTGSPTACTSFSLPDNTGSPYIDNFEAVADNCLDFEQPAAPVNLQFGGGDAILTCADSNNNNMADLQILTTWWQNETFSCGTGDPLLSPGAPSKCDYAVVDLVPIVDANMSIVKSVTDVGGDGPGGSVDEVGDVISYQLLVTNTGVSGSLSNVQAGDSLFEGFDQTADCTPAAPATLAPGASMTCTGTYTATQADIDNNGNPAAASGVVFNQAFASSNEIGVLNDTANVPIVFDPVVSLTKTASPVNFAAAGVLINYTLDVVNTGNTTLTSVLVSDPLPNLSAISCPGGNPIPTLAPGAMVTCTATYTTTQADVDAGSIGNTATATGSSPGNTDDVTASDNATVNSTAGASVSIVKTASPTSFSAAGVLISYTLAVTNDGGLTLTNVSVSDPLTGLSAVTCPGGNPIPTLAPAATVNCTATLTTTQDQVDAGSIDNTATATGSSPGNTDDVTASDNATVNSTAGASVSIVKTASPTTFAAAGELITYSLAVTNTGGLTLTGVLVSDPLAGLSAISCPGGNPIPTLAPGAMVTCTATYTTTQVDVDAGSIGNTATATGSSPGNTDDVTASDSATVANNAAADYTITKTVTDVGGDGPNGVANEAGDVITYEIVVANTGTTTLNNVNVTDALVALTCNPTVPATLDAGASLTCTGSYVVVQADLDNNGNPTPGSGMVANTAIVSSDDLPDETDSASVRVLPPTTPNPPREIPVNSPWALIMMSLLVLALGWYFRPAARRNF